MSTAAVANCSMSSASGEPPGWLMGSTYPGNYYQPSYTGQPNPTPDWNYWSDPNPYTTPNPYIQPITWPLIDGTGANTYRPRKMYMNCPHCGRNVEVKLDMICSSCRESMYVAEPVQQPAVHIDWPTILNGRPAAPEPPKEPEKPEKKDFFQGDGSRWDDI